jgi:hypothetical protein
MKNKLMFRAFLTIAILLSAQLLGWARVNGTTIKPVGSEDVITQWNRVLTDTVRTPGMHPATVMQVRSFAIMHAAMFDAVNSIDGTYTPYIADIPGTKNASIEAAAAYAAHDVLVSLYPARADVFAAELAVSIGGIEENRVQQGSRVGRAVAERILEVRANDGWNVTPPAYSLSMAPGNWQPTPPANTPAGFTHYPSVMPFAMVMKYSLFSRSPTVT